MNKNISEYGYRISLREDEICEIRRYEFPGLGSYIRYHLLGKNKDIKISSERLDLDKIDLVVDEHRRIRVSGEKNHTLIGFLE